MEKKLLTHHLEVIYSSLITASVLCLPQRCVYKDGAVDVETGKDASGQTFMTGTYDAAKDQVTLVMATQKEEKIVYSFEQNI